MSNAITFPYINQWGDEVLGEYVERAVNADDPEYNSRSVWQLQRLREQDYERRVYGREFTIVRFNASRAQSFRAGEFTRETARALRDMLDAALTEDDAPTKADCGICYGPTCEHDNQDEVEQVTR